MVAIILLLNFVGIVFGMQQTTQNGAEVAKVAASETRTSDVPDVKPGEMVPSKELEKEIELVEDPRMKRILKLLNNREQVVSRDLKRTDDAIHGHSVQLAALNFVVCFIAFYLMGAFEKANSIVPNP